MKYFTYVTFLFLISATLGVRLECYTCFDCGKTPNTWERSNCSLDSTEHYLCLHLKSNGTVQKECIPNDKEFIELCDAVNRNKTNSNDYCFYCERDLCNVNSAQIQIESCVILLLNAIILNFYFD
ncbi:uncharacterized protein LOC123004364 [Tribolium madens]|uniref:uncharacterized protein LOC123004364 n=1 Tax=Tribolium madens TaxID=41895 RepID=UPI001CF72F93|nr:uncharacterized protein LOC123004364 [Tribolium madens]